MAWQIIICAQIGFYSKLMKKLPKLSSELDSEITNNVLKKNFNILSPYFYKLITDWEIRAYKPFHVIL